MPQTHQEEGEGRKEEEEVVEEEEAIRRSRGKKQWREFGSKQHVGASEECRKWQELSLERQRRTGS